MSKAIWFLLLFSPFTWAQTSTQVLEGDTIYVIGADEDEDFLASGSKTSLNKQELKKNQYTDVHRILKKVPGVFLQEEDGEGLRPNIGFRGTHPHRSKKVTILEDGLLIGPAPYSAPAAYYFPLMEKMEGMDVFKGTSAGAYGPNSLGGAVNLKTAVIPEKKRHNLKLKLGPIRHAKMQTGGFHQGIGTLFQANHLKGKGFKSLSNGAKTGFEKVDLHLKNQIRLSKILPSSNGRLDTKFNYATEKSHETYLGLSQADFQINPYQRYNSTSNDLMNWTHYQGEWALTNKISSYIKLKNTFYYRQFVRDWSKVNGFASGPSIEDVLNSPEDYPIQHAILQGRRNSNPNNQDELLVIGHNRRRYTSMGLQNNLSLDLKGPLDSYHLVNLGLRVHTDQIKRAHTIEDHVMEKQFLKTIDLGEIASNYNHDSARALTLYAGDEISYKNLIINIGSRLEYVQYRRENIYQNLDQKNTDSPYLIPSANFNYQFFDSFSINGGYIHGLTLNGPGQTKEVMPEKSNNFEFGVRHNKFFKGELTGFYTHYNNIKGTCTASSGCTGADADQEFNGGEAKVLGYEFSASKTLKRGQFQFPLSVSYTKTMGHFASNVQSDNKEWGKGLIRKGDPLPYISRDQYSISIGSNYKQISSALTFNYTGKMADQAIAEGRKIIPARGLIDFNLKYQYSKTGSLSLLVDNLLDRTYIASLRPMGMRPGKPRSLSVSWVQDI